jgi:hypothetical protein
MAEDIIRIRRLHQRLTLAIRLRRPNQLVGRVVTVRPRQPRVGSPPATLVLPIRLPLRRPDPRRISINLR